jgi:hypothetical protein
MRLSDRAEAHTRAAVEQPLENAQIATTVVTEAHRYVDQAVDAMMAKLDSPPVRSPVLPADDAARLRLPFISEDLSHAMDTSAREYRQGTTLAYPPTAEGRFTDDELAALANLRLSPDARSALRKLVRDAASQPLFHLFALLDAVGDPELCPQDEWLPVTLSVRADDSHQEMMHDEFFESFHRYQELRTKRPA